MESKDFGVRVVRPFGQFQSGFVMFPTAMYREKLLQAGWVEEVKPDVPAAAPSRRDTLTISKKR